MIFWDASALLPPLKPLTAEHSAPQVPRSRVRVVYDWWFFWSNLRNSLFLNHFCASAVNHSEPAKAAGSATFWVVIPSPRGNQKL
jgi:hypothetical protein